MIRRLRNLFRPAEPVAMPVLPIIEHEIAEWYAMPHHCLLGPFSPREMQRYMLLGRIKPTTLVTRDGELWEAASGVPELVPVEMLTDGWTWKPTTETTR